MSEAKLFVFPPAKPLPYSAARQALERLQREAEAIKHDQARLAARVEVFMLQTTACFDAMDSALASMQEATDA